MIRRIDHIGLVSPSWQEARDVLLVKMGFPVSDWKGAGEKGTFFEPERTLNYFSAGRRGRHADRNHRSPGWDECAARFLAKRGPGLHHIGYAVDSVEDEATRLSAEGLRRIDLGPGAAFFFPSDVHGVLTELVPFQRPGDRLHSQQRV